MPDLYNPFDTKEGRRILRRNQTYAERVLWSQLRGRRCRGYKFYRQYGVGPYVLDFYCSSARLAIELDGPTDDDPEQRRHDARRTQHLNSLRIDVIRFTNDELMSNANKVYAAIEQALEGRPKSRDRTRR